MMSISSLLSDSQTNLISKSLNRTSSSSPIVRTQTQKVIQTIRPILSSTNSNSSPMNTSPNLSESSNDEQNGSIHQIVFNSLPIFDNSDTRNNNGFPQKIHYQVAQIRNSDTLSPYSSNNLLIPPLLSNNSNNKNKVNTVCSDSANLIKSSVKTTSDMTLPEAAFYDKDGMKYGIRCVCGDPHDDGFLVQCEKCEMWLHASCVNYSRNIKGEHFYCPFCLNTKILCICGKSMDYDLPLIQCCKCGNWSHKSCENIEFGIIPSKFVCTSCRKLEEPKLGTNNKVFYDIPFVKFLETDTDVLDLTIFTENLSQSIIAGDTETNTSNLDKMSIISSIPNGLFQKMIIEDLNHPELNFRTFIEKYFHQFAPVFFDRIHEFFRVFTETACSIFNINKNSVLRALDVLANHLLYDQSSLLPNINEDESNNDIKNENNEEENYDNDDPDNNDIEHSESIKQYLEELQVPRLEKIPINIQLYSDQQKSMKFNQNISNNRTNRRKRKKAENDENKNNTFMNDFSVSDKISSRGGVFTPVSLDDGSFITEIPGFLIHTDEIKADSGIPYSSILLTDDALIIDTKGTPFQQFSTRLRRSFHFNCFAKLVRIKGDLRVALFTTRLQGPLSEEKTRRGDAILANNELILPFDGDIPFPVQKVEWKDRRRRKFNTNFKENLTNIKNENGNSNNSENSEISNISSSSIKNNGSDSIIDSNEKEVQRKPKKKITQQNVAKRCSLNPNLTLLSTFTDESVPPMPFIILSDQEDIDTFKSHMERINDRILSQ